MSAHNDDLHPSLRPQIFEAVNLLKQKVGNGGIDEDKLHNAQRLIDECSADIFIPMARELVAIIAELVSLGRQNADTVDEKSIEDLGASLVQIRANGSMFRYPLMTRIAENALHFLQYVPLLDDYAYDVVLAHHDAMAVVLDARLEGPVGPHGERILLELSQVCARYFKNVGRTGWKGQDKE